MSEDPVILNYHNSLLRLSDLQLLQGPHWLNDILISFYFEYLENTECKNDDDLLFISPEVTQCLKVSPLEEMSIFLEPLHMKDRKFIFFALNDSEETDSPGGSHWSLLVYSKPEKTFFHFDSSSGFNAKHATKLAFNLAMFLGIQLNFLEQEPLQQTNCYDCGIHLLCNADNVFTHCKKYGKIQGVSLVKIMLVTTKRTQILELIESLCENQMAN